MSRGGRHLPDSGLLPVWGLDPARAAVRHVGLKVVVSQSQACPGWRVAALGHPDRSSSLLLSFATTAT